MALKQIDDEFKDFLRDLSYEPFFVHYYGEQQMHLYRNYCRNVSRSKIIIGATRGVVNSFKKLGIVETKTILLYEALAHDSEKGHSFTISNMISERHDHVVVCNWLTQWLSNDVSSPKETVCDQSLALLSAVVKCFTQYSSLSDCINACADIVFKKLPTNSRWIPNCYVRTDVAHFIKLVCKWTPLKTVPKRVKAIILRTIYLLVKCQSLDDMRSLISSLFIVLLNETDGNSIITGIETPCEKHRKYLIQATSTGLFHFEDEFNSILSTVENEAGEVEVQEEYDDHQKGLNSIVSPFQSWAEIIHVRSQQSIEEGMGLNAMYLPSLIPQIVKCFNLLPLWSVLMIPIFGYGKDTASSAAVESSFQKLKNITFKNISLPTDIETFIEYHTASLKSASLLRSTPYLSVSNNNVECENSDLDNNLMDECIVHRSQNEETTNHSDCPLTKSKNLSLEIEAQSYNISEEVILAATHSPCSNRLDRQNDISVNSGCLDNNSIIINNISDDALSLKSNDKYSLNSLTVNSTDTEITLNTLEGNTSVESQNRKPKKIRNLKSYSCPNPNLQYLRINNAKTIRSLPVLKNGCGGSEVKSCTLKNIGKVIINNTCAFDTVSSILMVAICDSLDYRIEVDKCENELFQFIKNLVYNGITSSTYSMRAEILVTTIFTIRYLNF